MTGGIAQQADLDRRGLAGDLPEPELSMAQMIAGMGLEGLAAELEQLDDASPRQDVAVVLDRVSIRITEHPDEVRGLDHNDYGKLAAQLFWWAIEGAGEIRADACSALSEMALAARG